MFDSLMSKFFSVCSSSSTNMSEDVLTGMCTAAFLFTDSKLLLRTVTWPQVVLCFHVKYLSDPVQDSTFRARHHTSDVSGQPESGPESQPVFSTELDLDLADMRGSRICVSSVCVCVCVVLTAAVMQPSVWVFISWGSRCGSDTPFLWYVG